MAAVIQSKIEKIMPDEDDECFPMYIKYPENLSIQDIKFLRKLMKLGMKMYQYHNNGEKKLQEIENFFKFLVDDVIGPIKNYYRLCEHRIFVRPLIDIDEDDVNGDLEDWIFINDWGFSFYDLPHGLLDEYYERYLLKLEHLEWTKRLINELLDDHDFQYYQIDTNNQIIHQSARSYMEQILEK
tara:strand:- start:94 stop:645 length:552 start_codon:yes stop_codon:yes gene_type:complete